MKRRFIIVAGIWCLLAMVGVVGAQSLDQQMSGIASDISKALVAKGYKNIAAVDFTDLQGQPTELGRFLSEKLTIEIVMVGGVSMVDRANIKSILAEHKLTEEGLVNPANAKKLGEFAGVDAILIGNVTALDQDIVLMVKAISTSSATIVAAGKIKFSTTREIQQLQNRGISNSPEANIAPLPGSGNGSSYQGANAIASKDIGSLRVVLKSILPRKDNQSRGIRCTFEFTNRETQKPIVVALNASKTSDRGGRPKSLRSTLLDDSGSPWQLYNTSILGIGFVGAGAYLGGRFNTTEISYDPSDIVMLLNKWEKLGTNKASYVNGANNFFRNECEFVYGSTTPIQHGQTVEVTMTFYQDTNQNTTESAAKYFQLTTEIVVGVVESNTRKTYMLQNLTFDHIAMPVF